MAKSRLFRIWLPLIFFTSSASSQTNVKNSRWSLEVGAGLRVEQFDWSIAGNLAGTNPDVLSELIWRNLKSTAFQLKSEYHIYNRLRVAADYHKSITFAGKVTDTDYQQDDRQHSSFSAELNSNKGNSTTFNIRLGFDLKRSDPVNLTAYLGYALNKRSLYLSDRETTASEGLKSIYTPSREGLTLRLKVDAAVAGRLSFTTVLTCEKFDYQAVADWNLIAEYSHPISFSQLAKGYAYESSLIFKYRLRNNISLFLNLEGFYLKTGKGTDRLYLATGEQVLTRFNGANNKSLTANTGLKFLW